METSNFCSEISVIPQYIGTCWFNAILMNSFYSQAMRKLMIKKVSKTWDKTNKVFKFFKTILKKSYNTEDQKIIDMFYNTKPQMLLITYAYLFDITLIKTIKKLKYGGYSSYISMFLKEINVKVLDIVYYHRISKCLLNSFKHMNKSSIRIDIDKEKKEIEQILTDVPDVLVLYNTKLYDYLDYNNLLLKNVNIQIHESDKYGINDEAIEDIKEYKDEIRLLGHVYKLDSIILENYNENKGVHAISGITCNNNKYVYNGWCKGTVDPALKQKERKKKIEPYPLVKYDWNLREDKNFCFKPEYSETIQEQKLCFSFNKGRRILIYVKNNREETSSLIRSNSYSSLSGKEEEFKKFHDLKYLTRFEIILKLNEKNIIYDTNLSTEKLKEILMNILNKEAGLLDDEKKYEYFTLLPIEDFKEEELIKIENNYYLKKNLFYYLFIYKANETYIKIIKFLIIYTPNNILLKIEQIKELIFYFFETEDLKEIYENYLKDDKARYNYKIKIENNFNLEANENYNINLILLLFMKTFGFQFFVKILNLKDTKEFMKYIIDEKNNFLKNYFHIHYTSNIKDLLEFLYNKCDMPITVPENERILINSWNRNIAFSFYYYIIYNNPFEYLTIENIKNLLFKFYDVEMNNYELLNTEIEKEENEEIKLKVKDTLLKIQENSIKGGKKKLLKRY